MTNACGENDQQFVHPTVFMQKSGNLSKDVAGRKCEHTAFLSAIRYKELDGDGRSTVQLHANECSKLILEVIKREPKVDEKDVVVSVPHHTIFDISKGQRAFIEAEEAQELLQPLMGLGNSHFRICFSNGSFGRGAACGAESVLKSNKD